eukprot:306942_1
MSFLVVILILFQLSVADNCNSTNKQKALYAYFAHEPSLADSPAFEIETEVTWVNVTSLRTWNKNGIYDAFMVHFEASPNNKEMGGYFGVQALTGTKGDMLLFSLWDSNPGNSSSWQAVIPKSSNCKRNKEDGSHANTPDGTTGTKCSVYIPFVDSGSVFRLHIQRTGINVSAIMYNRTWIGDEYEVSVKHIQSNHTWIIGSQLVDTSFSGINKMSTFCEHIGCTPCKAFEFASQRRGPWIIDPPGTDLIRAWTKQNGDQDWLCMAQETTSQEVGELELRTGTQQDFNSSAWNVDPIYVCNITKNECAYPGPA